jgi:hypothetical protein
MPPSRPRTRRRVSLSKAALKGHVNRLTASALARIGATRRASRKPLSPIAEGNERPSPSPAKPNLRIKIPYKNYVPPKIKSMIKEREEWPYIETEIEDLRVSTPLRRKILTASSKLYIRKMRKNTKKMREFQEQMVREYEEEERREAERRSRSRRSRARVSRPRSGTGIFDRIKSFLFGK